MNSIDKNFEGFKKALQSGQRIDCSVDGKWTEESWGRRLIRFLLGRKDERIMRVVSVFERALDRFEKASGIQSSAEAEVNYKLSREIFDLLSPYKFKNQTFRKKINEIEFKLLAFKLRLSNEKSLAKAESGELLDYAKKWKTTQKIYIKKALEPEEKEKLAQAAACPEFYIHLCRKENDALRDAFFKWALRDNCDVRAFMLFPATAERIKKCFLGARLGRFNISLVEERNGKKDCLVPFEVLENGQLVVKRFSVLDESKTLTMNKNYRCTIKQIFDSIGNRNRAPGNFECLGHRDIGNKRLTPRIANYNSLEMSPFDPKNPKGYEVFQYKEEWWKDHPSFDIIPEKDVKKWYGIEPPKGGMWVVAVRSTRESMSLDFTKSHGFMDVLIPNGKGEFVIYSPGKYAADWPQTILKQLFFLTGTYLAKFELNDENHFMPQRLNAISADGSTEKDGRFAMQVIGKSLEKAHQGHAVFQFGWKNCAHWVQHVMHKVFKSPHNYFFAPLVSVETNVQPVRSLLKFCRMLKGKVRSLALRIIRFLLLSYRSVVVQKPGKPKKQKSLESSGHSKKQEIFLPSLLHEKILKGEIPGIILSSNMGLLQHSG